MALPFFMFIPEVPDKDINKTTIVIGVLMEY